MAGPVVTAVRRAIDDPLPFISLELSASLWYSGLRGYGWHGLARVRDEILMDNARRTDYSDTTARVALCGPDRARKRKAPRVLVRGAWLGQYAWERARGRRLDEVPA
jgi:hypothetical protein